MQRACDICGTSFEAKRADARLCSQACRKRAQRAGAARTRKSVVAAGLTVVPDPPAAAAPAPVSGSLTASTEQALQAAGRANTWQGQSALELARRIDRAFVDTGSAYASLHREFRAAMTDALKGANVAKSAVQARRDELAARRAARQA